MTKANTARAEKPAADLRQRAARARDNAGRFIKRASAVEPPAQQGELQSAKVVEPDPAIAVTTVFRASWDALGNVLDAEVPDELSQALSDAQGVAYADLRAVRPTTPAGYRALAECWAIQLKGERGDEEGITLADDAADSLIAGAGACDPAEAKTTQRHPDAALFALGAQFMAAWAAEEEAPDGAGYWACNRLAQQIVQTPAVTAAGYGIKALLLARLDEDDSSPRKPAKAQGPVTSHWNVLRQVQQGAAHLAGASNMGIPISPAANPETGILVTAAASPAVDLVGLLDLASASMDELRTIRSLADLVGSVAYANAWRGCCQQGRTPRGASNYNDAGKLMNWLGDALTDVETAVDEEVAGRAPSNRFDRETRLSMLAVSTIDDGDPDAIKAFALELLDHASAASRGH